MRFDIREPFAFAFTFTRALGAEDLDILQVKDAFGRQPRAFDLERHRALSRYAVSSRSRMTKRASRMARK